MANRPAVIALYLSGLLCATPWLGSCAAPPEAVSEGEVQVEPATRIRPDGPRKPTGSYQVAQADVSVKPSSGAKLSSATAMPVAARSAPPVAHMELREFLAAELGSSRFHPRAQWAGRAANYQPVIQGRRIWKPIGQVNFITIHHAGGVPNLHPAEMIRRVYRGHTDANGRLVAADVGYHFFVDRNGHVWEARDASRQGTHVGSTPDGQNNPGNLGICGLGDYDYEYPPKAMVKGIVELCELIARYYGREVPVRGHGDWVGINGFNPRGGPGCPARLGPAVSLANTRIRGVFADPPEASRMTTVAAATPESAPAAIPAQAEIAPLPSPSDPPAVASAVSAAPARSAAIETASGTDEEVPVKTTRSPKQRVESDLETAGYQSRRVVREKN